MEPETNEQNHVELESSEQGDPVEMAKAVLEREKQQRVKQCAEEISALLEKLQCKLNPITVIIGQQITQRVEIVPA